ncbi:hypothetical protein OH773_11100 [Buttiauxella sp. WJP83]|uniref:hypothetical protein n=1 Tax=Buttiauxella sp. WJP83 TaxID=2986951 RepID=UPI0022DE375B|nr:hypothetical protein [Buttiauxella sp. WJP83]WBM68763.1 hypothetical protein OH773_11100 [Buttiauxella sp. WJP83]
MPLKVYNINSLNARGFAVIDKNISNDDRNRFNDENLKMKIYFCMIHKDGFALCGTGSLTTIKDGKEVDLTPYALKSLESMEIGIKVPKVNNEK